MIHCFYDIGSWSYLYSFNVEMSFEKLTVFNFSLLIVLDRYGILIDPIMWLSVFLKNPYSWPSFCLVIGESCISL